MDPNVLTAIIGMVSGAVVVLISRLFDLVINRSKINADANVSMATAAEKTYANLLTENVRLTTRMDRADARQAEQQITISGLLITIDEFKAANARLNTIIQIYHAHILRQNDAMASHGLIALIMPSLPEEDVKKKYPTLREQIFLDDDEQKVA